VFEISAVSRAGLRPLTFALADMVRQYREDHPKAAPKRTVIRPIATDESGFSVIADPQEPGGFIVRGTRPERWVRQTQFDNDEAVGYLADRLARLGVEAELVKQGAEPGCSVTIGDVSFEWEPQVSAGVDIVPTGRGTDIRLENNDRIGAAERKLASRARRGLLDEDGK
jgi:GTP-binding protein